MTVTQHRGGGGYATRPNPSGLADVIDTILDKGLVIDIYVRVSLVGIELLTIDARIVIASVDTYLRFAEAVNRMDLTETQTSGIPELMEDLSSSGAKGKTSGAIEGAKEKLSGILGGDEEEDEEEKKPAPRKRTSSSKQSSRSRPARKSTARQKQSEES
ncbi:MAG TPA: gas vesicle protein GvpJ [Nocardioidaceae bacterium]|nr:gas vesicle protein GvpJ [Nocardioidaceae bacterium]